MSRMTSTYEVSRPSGRCAATGREIAVGEPFVAVLVERGADGALERLDYSVEAWSAGSRPAGVVIGTWRGTMPAADGPKRGLIDDAELIDLFEQLGPATGQRQLAFRYILTLILIRKRLLRHVGTRRGGEGGEVLLVQLTKAAGGGAEDPPIEVVDPGLDEQTIAEATEQLGMVMLGGGDGAPGAAAGA